MISIADTITDQMKMIVRFAAIYADLVMAEHLYERHGGPKPVDAYARVEAFKATLGLAMEKPK
jgi:hypothetical protein